MTRRLAVTLVDLHPRRDVSTFAMLCIARLRAFPRGEASNVCNTTCVVTLLVCLSSPFTIGRMPVESSR